MGLNPGYPLECFLLYNDPFKTTIFFLDTDMVKPNSNDDQPLEIQELIKVENILKGSLVWIPSPSVKIQIMDGKFFLRCKGRTLLGIVNKLSKTKILLAPPSNVFPYYLKYA